MTMAQDVIVKKDGTTIQSRVIEINATEIKYKKWSNQEGPLYSINRSEIMSINYQNGEIEKFAELNSENPSPSDLPIYTEEELKCVFYHPYHYTLLLGEKEMTQKELRILIGEDGYESFMSGHRMIKTTQALEWPFYLTGAAGMIGLISGYIKDKDGGYNYTARTVGWIGIGVAVPLFVLNTVFSKIGTNRINEVVNEYNRNNPKTISFNIAPSLMQSQMALSEGNTGFGLTFSLNF